MVHAEHNITLDAGKVNFSRKGEYFFRSSSGAEWAV
jgi:hypothetical protein